jgi:competence protein ComEC
MLTQRLHCSWLIAWLASGFLAGIALIAFINIPCNTLQLVLIALPCVFLGFIKRTKAMVICMLIAGLSLGMARGSTVRASLAHYQPYYGQVVLLKGKVSEDTTLGSKGDQRVVLHSVYLNSKPLPGAVWVSTDSHAVIKRGDQVAFKGLLVQGFGTTAATMFRAQLVEEVRPIHGDVAREVRDWFAEGVRRAIAEPEASLGVGYLVGQRSALPADLDNQLRLLGLSHVVVASGYNLTILVRFTRRAFAPLSKYLATATAFSMIASFVLITGFSPSMSRAALVTTLSLLAWYYGRTLQPLVILPFSAAITALINPVFVWGDIGWYLSFTSFAGVMIVAPLLKHYFWGDTTELPAILQVVLETLSAQVATLPIIVLIFKQLSFLALPANVLILPFIPLAMLLTFLAGLGSIFVPGVASYVGMPAQMVLRYMTWVTDKLAQLPGASEEVIVSIPAFIVSYVVLISSIYLIWRATDHRFSQENIVL